MTYVGKYAGITCTVEFAVSKISDTAAWMSRVSSTFPVFVLLTSVRNQFFFAIILAFLGALHSLCYIIIIIIIILLLLYLFQSSQKPIQLPSVCINEKSTFVLETLWRNQEHVAIEVYFGKQDDTNAHFISDFRICFWFRLSICLIHRQAAEYVRRFFKSHTVRVRSLFYFMNKNIKPFHCQRRIWLLANPELSNEIGTCYLVLKATCPRANFDPSPCLTNYNSKVWIGAF